MDQQTVRTPQSNGLVVRDTQLMEFPYAPAGFAEFYGGQQRKHHTLRDYMKVLFRQKSLILATVFAVTATVYAGLQMRTPQYEAGVKMLILAEKQVESPYYRSLDDSFKSEASLTQSEIVKSNPVLERTVKALRLDERPLDYEREFASPLKRWVIDLKMQAVKPQIKTAEQERFMRFKVALESLKHRVKVKPVSNTNLFSINVRDFSPIASATVANTISRYYVIFDLEQQLAELQMKYGEKHLAVTQLKDHIRSMEKTLAGSTNSYIDAMGPASVKILEQASLPTEPTGLPKSLILLAAFLASLLLGVTLAFTFDWMDPTFRSPEEIEKELGVTVLGSVPKRKFGGKILTREPLVSGKYSVSFQHLADQLHLALKDKGFQALAFTSACPGEGASTIVANLGNYLSRNLSHKVLLIDANLRHPDLHRIFRIPNNTGLSETLESKNVFEGSVWEITPRLSVLPAGKSKVNPVRLLDSSEMTEVIRKAREAYEIVLVDCPPLKNQKDTELLSNMLDGLVLVVESGRGRRRAVKAAIQPLEQRKATFAGAVLNKRLFALPKVIYERV